MSRLKMVIAASASSTLGGPTNNVQAFLSYFIEQCDAFFDCSVIDWKANGLFTQSTSGTNQVVVPGFREQTQGSANFAAASASGSVVGTAITLFNGAQIGTNHSVTINIFR